MTTSNSKPPKRRLLTGRSFRGGVVFSANAGGVLIIADGIYVSVAMSLAGHPGSGIGLWTVVGAFACFSLAGVIASPRASDAILRLFEMLAHVGRPTHEPSSPPPLDPGKWPEVKSRDTDDPSQRHT